MRSPGCYRPRDLRKLRRLKRQEARCVRVRLTTTRPERKATRAHRVRLAEHIHRLREQMDRRAERILYGQPPAKGTP